MRSFRRVVRRDGDREYISNGAQSVLLSIVFTARRDDFHIAPSVRRCEKLARQAKPPGETACPTHFANPCTARKVGQTVSSAGPPKSIFHTSSARGRVYWPNRPRADAWGCVAAMEYG